MLREARHRSNHSEVVKLTVSPRSTRWPERTSAHRQISAAPGEPETYRSVKSIRRRTGAQPASMADLPSLATRPFHTQPPPSESGGATGRPNWVSQSWPVPSRAGGQRPAAVGGERRAKDGVFVREGSACQTSRPPVPEPCCSVPTCGQHESAVRAEAGVEHPVGVSQRLGNALAGRRVPKANR